MCFLKCARLAILVNTFCPENMHLCMKDITSSVAVFWIVRVIDEVASMNIFLLCLEVAFVKSKNEVLDQISQSAVLLSIGVTDGSIINRTILSCAEFFR